MTRIFTDLNQILNALVPGWAVPYVLGLLAALAVPLYLETVRGRQIKSAVRQMVRADGSRRHELEQRALYLAGRRRGRLIGLVQEAIRYGQPSLLQEGLTRLDQHPRGAGDAAALRKRVEPEPVRFRDPVEAVVRISRLLDQGLLVAADEQLVVARTQYPHDEELEGLHARLADLHAAGAGSE